MNYSTMQNKSPVAQLLDASKESIPEKLNEIVSNLIHDRFDKKALSGIRLAAELFSNELYVGVRKAVNDIVSNLKNDEPFYDALKSNDTPASTLIHLASQLDGNDREAFVRQVINQPYPLETLSQVVREVPEARSDKVLEKFMKTISNTRDDEEKDKLINMAINSAKDDADKRIVEEMLLQTSNQVLKLKGLYEFGEISQSELAKIETDILKKNDVNSSANIVSYFNQGEIDINKHLDQVLKSNDKDAIAFILRSNRIEEKIPKDKIEELQLRITKDENNAYTHASLTDDSSSKIHTIIQQHSHDEPVHKYEDDCPSLG